MISYDFVHLLSQFIADLQEALPKLASDVGAPRCADIVFAFCRLVGRFIGAGVNFALATIGTSVALAAVASLGLLIIPCARETRSEMLPT